jgi:acyl carrier protein
MSEKNSPAEEAALQLEIADLMVQALNLDVSAADIKPDEPLYGDGLGLDSIDILEVALVVSKRYGLQLKADSDDNHRIFGSLRSLTEYVAAHKTR